MTHSLPKLPLIIVLKDDFPTEDLPIIKQAWQEILLGPPELSTEFEIIIGQHTENPTQTAFPAIVINDANAVLTYPHFKLERLQKKVDPQNILTDLHDLSVQLQKTHVKFSDFYFDLENRTAGTHDETAFELTDLEKSLILYLSYAQYPVKSDELLRHVWHYHEDIDSNTLQTMIYRLRERLEKYIGPDARNAITGSDGKGYRIHEKAQITLGLTPISGEV